MNDSRDYLEDILRNLIRHEVKFIVCGGVAAVLHGVERLTVDLDITLDMSDENLHRFVKVMKEECMIPRAPVPPESICDRELLQRFVEEKGAKVFTFQDPRQPFKQIDLFITQDASYDRLIQNTDTILLEPGCPLKILTSDHSQTA